MGVSRRLGRRVTALLTATMLVLAACSGGGGSGGGSDDAVRYGIDFGLNLSDTFNPATSVSACDKLVLQFIYGTLTTLDEERSPQPSMAESFEVTDGGRTVTLGLREGVEFSDGTPYDAEAVAGGLEYLKTGEQTADELRIIETIDVVDDRTVQLNLSENTGSVMPYILAGREGMIPAPSTIQGDAPAADEDPIGAGPFTLESFRPERRIELRANETYSGPEDFEIPGIDFVQVGVGVPAVNALKGGELDVTGYEAESQEAVEAAPHVESDTRLGEVYAQLQFRLDEPFDDVLVRQAVNHAIDRERFNEVVLAGLGEVAWQPYPEDALAFDPDQEEQYPYDPDRARELLVEAGLPDGFEFDMVIPGGVSGQERQGEFLQEQFAEVGITANLIPSTEIANEYYLQKTGDAFSAARLAGAGPTNQLFDQWGNFQFVAIHNFAERDDITNLVKQAREATTPEEAQPLLQEAVAIVVDEALEAPLAFQPRNVAWDTDRIGGSIQAPADVCDPFDLQDASIR